MALKTLDEVIVSLDKEIAEIKQDSEIILKLEDMIDKIIKERDLNVSKAIGSIKETIQRSEFTEIKENDPLSISLKQAIDTRNITAKISEKEMERRIQKIKQRITSFKLSLRFLKNVIGEEAVGNYIAKTEAIEDNLIELL